MSNTLRLPVALISSNAIAAGGRTGDWKSWRRVQCRRCRPPPALASVSGARGSKPTPRRAFHGSLETAMITRLVGPDLGRSRLLPARTERPRPRQIRTENTPQSPGTRDGAQDPARQELSPPRSRDGRSLEGSRQLQVSAATPHRAIEARQTTRVRPVYQGIHPRATSGPNPRSTIGGILRQISGFFSDVGKIPADRMSTVWGVGLALVARTSRFARTEKRGLAPILLYASREGDRRHGLPARAQNLGHSWQGWDLPQAPRARRTPGRWRVTWGPDSRPRVRECSAKAPPFTVVSFQRPRSVPRNLLNPTSPRPSRHRAGGRAG